jgi:hypothetical protein
MNTETKMSRHLAKTVYVSLVTIFINSSISLTTIVNAQELAPPAGLDDLTVESTRAMANELLTQLGQKLKSTMSKDGPEAAVSVCKEASPSIAKTLSSKHGAQMTRVGTRVRNPSMGTPNLWQKDALAQFENRLAQGETPASMEYWKVVDVDQGKRELHYAKAIMVQPICLSCHGAATEIPTSLAEKIRLEYPQDQATGYSVGKLRGAVVVSKPLN